VFGGWIAVAPAGGVPVTPAVPLVVQDSTICAIRKAPDATPGWLGIDSLISRQVRRAMVTRAWLSTWQTVNVGSAAPAALKVMLKVPAGRRTVVALPGTVTA
jgi:hypothetical protein